MKLREDIIEFYDRIHYDAQEVVSQDRPHINVFERSSCIGSMPYSRRDYYKVTLIQGKGTLEYADKTFEIKQSALLFSTPKIPYRWKGDGGEQPGWFCIFNEAFVKKQDDFLYNLPMFQIGTDKLFYLTEETENLISVLFKEMVAENSSNYQFKQEILRSYLHLIIHQVIKSKPFASNNYEHNASERLAMLFLELLERQFPIDAIHNQLTLKSAKDYADRLSVHTNHLNRAVKEITGETTSYHISNRIIAEANGLLRYTNWPISEVAYSLGFEYPAYFNNFYKKHTGKTPRETRKLAV